MRLILVMIAAIVGATAAPALALPAPALPCDTTHGEDVDCDVAAGGVRVVADPSCGIDHPWCEHSWSWAVVADACMPVAGDLVVQFGFAVYGAGVGVVPSVPTGDASCLFRAHFEDVVGCAEICLPEECLHAIAFAPVGVAESLVCDQW